jgi:hypothetical protein
MPQMSAYRPRGRSGDGLTVKPLFQGCERHQLKEYVGLFLLFLAMCPASFGWGHEGHQIIATVAEDHFDETTKVMVQSLLGNNHLYSIASWADDVRRERSDTRGWHYVDIPLGGKYTPWRLHSYRPQRSSPRNRTRTPFPHFASLTACMG